MIQRRIAERLRPAVGKFGRVLGEGFLFVCFLAFPVADPAASEMSALKPWVVTLPAGVTCAEIQKTLDGLPRSGGEVILPAGKILVSQPIVLQRDCETLRGAGAATILFLADNANCPVIIMGQPVNNPQKTIKDLRVSNLVIDGNRLQQQRELWRLQGEGSNIRNNGITIQKVRDSIVEHVTCAHCRSGGLVTTLGVRRLTVWDLDAFDNEFDGLACYLTEDSTFTKLFLHDNSGAGISLDLAFNHNVIDDAILAANNLGIFMRDSRYNQFEKISIRDSHDYGVFMAQACEPTARGWQPAPQTECTNNSFTKFIANKCGAAAFRINDIACTNNVIIGAQFNDNLHGGLSLVEPNLLTVQNPPPLAGD
jgi:hypothetical protein